VAEVIGVSCGRDNICTSNELSRTEVVKRALGDKQKYTKLESTQTTIVIVGSNARYSIFLVNGSHRDS